MGERKTDLRAPKLRDEVAISWRGDVAVLSYREQGCEIDIPKDAKGPMTNLLRRLRDGVTLTSLEREVPALSAEIPNLVEELDRLGLVVEGSVAKPKGGMSGAEFYRCLRRFAARVAQRSATNLFYDSLVSGAISESQLVGYAIEYYHLVHYAPRIIAPAIGHSDTPRTHHLLTEFLTSELGHDRMLLQSLRAVGIEREQLENLIPLPSTFALISALGVFAAQDVLAFKSALFIYEDVDNRFSTAFADRAQSLGLARGFSEPILRHASLNNDHAHGDISKELLAEVPYISLEEQISVKKHIAVTIETLINMERAILDYYSNPNALPDRAGKGTTNGTVGH